MLEFSKDVYKTMICRCFNKKIEIKLGINGLLPPNYKMLVKVQKNRKEMNIWIFKFLALFSPPYHAITL
jgi:hypothetical protein